jgi:hypothetical protein
MKGMSFQNGIEFRVTLDGESWLQGETIHGRVESKPASKGLIYLAEGLDKKVKAKSADAFIILQELKFEAPPFDWKFQLPVDARISDKAGALYLLYGRDENTEKSGQLRLNILPNSLVKDLIELLSTHFRFPLKATVAGKKGVTEFKFDPPSGKDWSMLESLVLLIKTSEKELDCKFQFQRNEVDATKGGLSTKSVKREVNRCWIKNEIIHEFNLRMNKDIMTIEIDQVIDEYRSIGWLSS